MTDFVHLKVKSHWSATATSSPSALVWRALSQEYRTLALTDDMTLAGWPEFMRACRQAGIHPIAGCTLYHAPVTFEAASRPAYPITVLAESLAGYHNLLRCLHLIHIPRLPWRPADCQAYLPLRELIQSNEGLIVLIGGPESELGQAVADGNARAASIFLDAICDVCPRANLDMEIVRLGPDQINDAEPGLLEMAHRWGIATAATNDVHCAAPAQYPAHAILNHAAGMRYYDGTGVIPNWPPAGIPHVASAAEMLRKFSDARRLCAATVEIAERCAWNPDEDIPILGIAARPDAASNANGEAPEQFPKLDFPRGQSEESYVWNDIFTRAREHHAQIAGELKERLNREFEALKNAGCLPYLAFLARMVEGLPRHLAYRFKRPGFTSSQAAFYLGLNYLPPHELKINFSLEDVAAGLGDPIQLEIPSGSEGEFQRALGALIGEDRLAAPVVIKPMPAAGIAAMLCAAMDLSGKQAVAATEFLTELADETAARFFADDMPEPPLEDIIRDPCSPGALARLFFDLRDASPTAIADSNRLIFTNTKLNRLIPLFYPGATPALQWPAAALETARLPALELIPRDELQLVSQTLKLIHEEGLSGAPPDCAGIPVEHKSVLQLLAGVDTALIPFLAGIEARVCLQRLKPESFSALTKLLTPALARKPFFDRVADLALACKMAYLQMNYLQDYFLAYVGQRLADPNEMRRILRRLRREDVPVFGPRINISAPHPTLRDNGLQLALSMLRGYTTEAYEAIAAARREMPYSDLVDFLQRVDQAHVTPEFIESLIESGAFDIIERHRRRLWEQWQRIKIWLAQTALARKPANSLGMDWDAVREMYLDTARKMEGLEEWSFPERIQHERRACGFEISGDPLECHRDFLDLSNIYTGPLSKRLVRKNLTFFWAGYAESLSVEHPQLEMLDNHALLDLGEFWGMMPLAEFEAHRDWLEQGSPGVFQAAPSATQGITLFEILWAASLDQCAWEAASRPTFEIDCAGWDGGQFRQMVKLCKLFPGNTRLLFQRVPARFVRKATRLQSKGIYFTPTFYRAIPQVKTP